MSARWAVAAASFADAALVQLPGQTIVCGGSLGPSPEELLLAGLAGCTAIFVGRNAILKGIPLEGSRIRVRAPATLERMEKRAEIVANISDAEFEIIK